MTHVRKEKARGFTLVEVMIASAIFAVGFSAVGLLTTGAAANYRTARQDSRAGLLATQMVERFRGYTFDQMAALASGAADGVISTETMDGMTGTLTAHVEDQTDRIGLWNAVRLRASVVYPTSGREIVYESYILAKTQ